jgi:hypothetical protein
MHLYRLACRYPEVQDAYTDALSYKRFMADMTATDALLGAAYGPAYATTRNAMP